MNIENLSLEEKIGQMFMFGVKSNNIDILVKLIKEYKIGGVILYKNNYSSYDELITVIKKLKDANKDNKIPLFISIDQEGGRVNRMPKEIVNMKNIYDLSSLNDDKLIIDSADILSKLLVGIGINMNFAPVLDIYNGTDSNVLYKRCFSTDVDIVSKYGLKYMKKMQSNNLISVIKHFPGHGISEKDSHFLIPYVKNSEELFNKHLLPFENAINNGADALMVGHLVIKGITNGLPASISRDFISKYIREKYNYDGLIVTDDLKMGAVNLIYRFFALEKAFTSGSDIILFKYHNGDERVINKVVDKVKNNSINITDINRSVDRILNIKSKYKINDDTNYDLCDIDKINKKIISINNKYEEGAKDEK